MTKIWNSIILAALMLAGLATAAYAQAMPEQPIGELVKPVVDAVLAGDYWLAASALLILLTTAAYRYMPGRAGKLLRSTPGKALSVFLVAFGGALVASLAGVATMSPALAYGALKAALAAAGGYSTAKALIYPLLAWLEKVAPGWMGPAFSVLLWAFRSGDPDKAAKEAGDAAVAANPPTGVGGITNGIGELE